MLYGYRQFHCIHKKDYIYQGIAEDFETRFDASNYKLDRLLPKGKNKYAIGLMKDELGTEIMTKFVGLKAKTCSYLIDDSSKYKKATATRKKKNLNLKIIKTVQKKLNLRIK